ncbi:MAG: sugar transferase, partial [Raoultibacter sp.]
MDNNSSASVSFSKRLHPGVEVHWAPGAHLPNCSYAHFKRVVDGVCSAVAIVLLSPLLIACAFAIKMTSKGPVLFRQERWGRSRTHFECLKFRTMIVETPPNMPAGSFANQEDYMTLVGNFLRHWSLDELPQLFNIIKGDMSIVGPRPVIIAEESLIDKRGPLKANCVRPGLTGWAQINGRNLVNDEEKAYLDGEYVANMSFLFDMKIFLKTIVVVLGR